MLFKWLAIWTFISKLTPKRNRISVTFVKNVFLERSSLKYHIRTHTKEKPYHGARFVKCFSWRSYLIRHIKTHTKNKAYWCEFSRQKCFHNGVTWISTPELTQNIDLSVNFVRLNVFLNHRCNLYIRTHTKEKPYQCDLFKIAMHTLIVYCFETLQWEGAHILWYARTVHVHGIYMQGSKKCGSTGAALLGNNRPNLGKDADWEKTGK